MKRPLAPLLFALPVFVVVAFMLSWAPTTAVFTDETRNDANVFQVAILTPDIYVGTGGGELYGYNSQYVQMFQTNLSANAITDVAYTGLDEVYAATDAGELIKADRTDGTEIFTVNTGDGPLAGIATDQGGAIYTASSGGVIRRYNPAGVEQTGESWPVDCGCVIFDIAVTASGEVLVGNDGREARFYTPNGNELWVYTGPAPPGNYDHVGVAASDGCRHPVVGSNTSIAQLCSDGFVAGTEDALPGTPTDVLTTATGLLVAFDDGSLSNYEQDGLIFEWNVPLPVGVPTGLAADTSARLFVIDGAGDIARLDLTDGSVLSSATLGLNATSLAVPPGQFAASGLSPVSTNVQITAPANNALLSDTVPVTLEADLTNSIGETFTQAEYYFGTDLIGTVAGCAPTCTLSLDTTGFDDGVYQLNAGGRYDGRLMLADPIQVVIGNDEFVLLNAPTSPSAVQGTAVELIAEASLTSSGGGTFEEVTFLIDGVPTITVVENDCSTGASSVVCTGLWDSTAGPDGPVEVSASATFTDDTLTSMTADVFVFNGDLCGTGVQVASPQQNATVMGNTFVAIQACDAAAERVEVAIDGVPIGTAQLSNGLAAVAWHTSAYGFQMVEITVEAFDEDDVVVASGGPVDVTVDNFPPAIGPSAQLAVNNLTGSISDLDDDPTNPQLGWYTSPLGGEDTSVTVGFEPTPPLVGLQTVEVAVRKNAAGGRDPSVEVRVFDGATEVVVSAEVDVLDGVYQTETVTFDAGDLVDPANADIRVQIEGFRPGGPPGDRRSVEVGAVRWTVNQ